jgi:hypothetical protein
LVVAPSVFVVVKSPEDSRERFRDPSLRDPSIHGFMSVDEPERANRWVITMGDEVGGAINCKPVANKNRRDYCDAKRLGEEAILFVREWTRGFGEKMGIA